MLSRTRGAMFKVKQLFTKNYLLLMHIYLLRLHITLYLVYFNSFEVIRSKSLRVSKTYQYNHVTSIKKLLGVPNSFSLCYEIVYKQNPELDEIPNGQNPRIGQNPALDKIPNWTKF